MAATNHVHSGALSALVRAADATKTEVARRAEMTPGQLADLLSGRRAGTSDKVRELLAEALTSVGVTCTAYEFTCWCEDRPRHQREVER